MDKVQEIDDITNLSKSLYNSMMFDDANGQNSNINLTLAYIIFQKLTNLRKEIYS